MKQHKPAMLECDGVGWVKFKYKAFLVDISMKKEEGIDSYIVYHTRNLLDRRVFPFSLHPF